VLLAGLADSVHFGREFARYERTADGKVTAYFADGTSATGDVLVGADGARSRVRRQLLPNTRRIDTPAIGVGGKLPLTGETVAWLPEQLTATKNMVLPPRDFLFTAVFRQEVGGERGPDRRIIGQMSACDALRGPASDALRGPASATRPDSRA
jgi:2-polyprenyl-6-methoxyphenol hydroxylase-like FAD-dependent oxidoreductase